MKFYVVNYKETHTCCGSVTDVNSGVCDFGYKSEKDAIKQCWKLSDDILNSHLDALDENNEKIEDGENDENDEFYREVNENGDYQTVYYYGDTFEYWVSVVEVI